MNPPTASLTMKSIMLLVLVVAVLILPSYMQQANAYEGITGYQFGQNFKCAGGSATGQLYTGGGGCPGDPSNGQIFSYFVCKFEEIIRDALGKVYCSIVQEATPGVTAALTLAVLFQGMMFLMGVSPFTVKELMVFAGKFSCVLAFALHADYMIGIGYALFMSIAKEGIVIVLSYLFQGGYSSANDVYKIFDDTLVEIMGLASQDSKQEGGQCKNAIFSMVVLAAAALPPVALIGIYFMFKLVYVMLRAVFGYCQGILGVTFLVTLAPIYVSFALFKPTRVLFDKWVQYLISFSFQMVIVFAFLGMAFNIMKKIADDITDYTALVKPYNQQYANAGLSQIFNMCGICEMDKIKPNEKPKCKSDKVMEIGELAKDQNFLHFVSVKIFAMIIMFYLLDTMMDLVPQMARLLTGPKGVAQLGGGKTDTERGENPVNVNVPGEEAFQRAMKEGAKSFNRGGVTPTAMVAGLAGVINSGAQSAVRNLGEAAAGAAALVGGRELMQRTSNTTTLNRSGAGQQAGFVPGSGDGGNVQPPARGQSASGGATVARNEDMAGSRGVQRASNDSGGDKNDDIQNAVMRGQAIRRDTNSNQTAVQTVVQHIVSNRPTPAAKPVRPVSHDGKEDAGHDFTPGRSDGFYDVEGTAGMAMSLVNVSAEDMQDFLMAIAFDPDLSWAEKRAIANSVGGKIGGGGAGFEPPGTMNV